MFKKDNTFYILVAALAILDILIPILLYKWSDWAPELFSVKRIGLHLLAFVGAVGFGSIASYGVKTIFAKLGALKIGVVVLGGTAVATGYIKVINQKEAIVKPPLVHQNTIVVSDTTNKTFNPGDIQLALQSNSAGIVAGGEYEAKLLVYQPSIINEYDYFVNGKQLVVNKDGEIYYKEKAIASHFDANGISKKTVKITAIRKDDPKRIPIVIDDYYQFSKPYLLIQSATISALYLRCMNPINISVPALGGNFNPDYKGSTGGSFIKGEKIGELTIVPEDPSVTLKVSSNGNVIGEQKLNVRAVPKPTIVVLSGGRQVDEKMGFPAPGPRSLTVDTYPDEYFKTILPLEARYNIGRVVVTLARGKRPILTETFNSGNLTLTNMAASAQPGDRIILEISDVTRLSAVRGSESVNMGVVIKTIPIN